VAGKDLSALFDTGSVLTLVNSKFKNSILKTGGISCADPDVKLCGANGTALETAGSCKAKFHLGNKTFEHQLLFISDLKVDCIIGMDLMAKANIKLDPRNRKIIFEKLTKSTLTELACHKTIILPANSETAVLAYSPVPFESGLIEPNSQSDGSGQTFSVMDGLVRTFPSDNKNICNLIISNFQPFNITLTKNTKLCEVDISSELQVFSIEDIKPPKGKPQPQNEPINVDLSQVPMEYRNRYHELITKFQDVFSKNDLDVGHCTSLPHKVRLKDPNRITSINQYRLPFHLKHVAIDYVHKLLQAGVVRKSSSVFNSPLMLVKKPQADPNKPLAEQYRLVHNYIDLNKNISPCSYPLRNLYELLGNKQSLCLHRRRGDFRNNT